MFILISIFTVPPSKAASLYLLNVCPPSVPGATLIPDPTILLISPARLLTFIGAVAFNILNTITSFYITVILVFEIFIGLVPEAFNSIAVDLPRKIRLPLVNFIFPPSFA